MYLKEKWLENEQITSKIKIIYNSPIVILIYALSLTSIDSSSCLFKEFIYNIYKLIIEREDKAYNN